MAIAVVGLGLGQASVMADETVITFDNGAEGMIGPSGPGGATNIDLLGGNPGANMHTVFSNFGITFRNSSNPAFIGDYTASGEVTISIDTKVESIDFFGSPVPRPWLVELRDYDDPEPGYPYTSVWYKFADIAEATHGNWQTFSITIADTSSVDLPAGWGGYGAEDPETFEPILPADRTFTDVLAGIDEIAFTTYEPGFFFGETAFDLRIDNVALVTPASGIPATSEWGLAAMALLLATTGTLTYRRAAVPIPVRSS
jgi:hypothetical protein